MTDYITDPDTGGSPARDYASVSACMSGEAGDQAGASLVALMRSTAGSADTSRVVLTTAITNYSTVEIRPYPGEEHEGKWDSSKARFHGTAAWNRHIYITTPDVIVDGIQLRVDGNYENGIDVDVNPAGGLVEVTNNLVRYGGSTKSVSTYSRGLSVGNGCDAAQSVKFTRNVVYGGWGYGQLGGAGTVDYDRNTFHDCNWGAKCGYSDNIYNFRGNLIIGSRVVDFQYGYMGGMEGDANGTSDATSPDGVSFQNLSIAFADAPNGDFSLAATDTDAMDVGVSIAGIAADIIGTVIPQGAQEDLGAFESISDSSYSITSTTDTLTITENSGTVTLGTTIIGTTDLLVITENAGAVSSGNTITGTTDPLVITENPGIVTLGTTIIGTTDLLVITENAGAVSSGNTITGTTDPLVITEHPGTVTLGHSVQGTTDNLTITEHPGAISFGNLITGTTDPIIITEHPGTITLGTSIIGITDTLTLTEHPGSITIGTGYKVIGTTVQLKITEHPGTVTLKRLATDAMHKLQSLRTHILELPVSAGFKIHANDLVTIIEKGSIVSANGHQNQNFEWIYPAEIIIKNLTGNANVLIFWILQWLHTNQPNHVDEAIQFQADILNGKSADIGITIELTEVVQVEQTADGIQLINPDSPDASVLTLPATEWSMTLNDDPTIVAEWPQLPN